jgi:hypothetical protein
LRVSQLLTIINRLIAANHQLCGTAFLAARFGVRLQLLDILIHPQDESGPCPLNGDKSP